MSEFLLVWLIPIFASTLRMASPLILASLGGFFSEKSGVINIALEGFMLLGAFFAAIATLYFHSPWIGFFIGGLSGAFFALIYVFFIIEFKSDQVVSGMAFNILALGIPPFINKILYDSTGSTPSLDLNERLGNEVLILILILAFVINFWFKHTPSGLWLNFSGEHPKALETTGVSVKLIRYLSVCMSGFLAGLGGATLSLYLSSSYSRNMTAGRGFMALAALIFGNWKPIPTLWACLFFGLTDAIQMRLQGIPIFGLQIPIQFIQVLPYLFTIIVLAGFIGKSSPPKELGKDL